MSASPDVLWAAWTGVGVWAVAVPLAHLALLQLGMRKDDALVGDYRPDRQWWEVVVVLEKLALTGFLALYNPGAWQQLFVATVIALFCFVLQMLVRPYRRESDNTFALLTSLSLVPLFLGSLALQVDATITIYRISAVGGSKLELALLFGFVILVLVALAAFFVWEHSQARELLVLQSTGRPPSSPRRRPTGTSSSATTGRTRTLSPPSSGSSSDCFRACASFSTSTTSGASMRSRRT